MQARRATHIKWVHSHVNEEKRQTWKANCNMKCACGGQGKNRCDPDHEHHRGNDRADSLAGKAIKKEPPKDHKKYENEENKFEKYFKENL